MSGQIYKRMRDGALYFCDPDKTTYHAQWGKSVYLRPKHSGRSHWKSVERFNAEYQLVRAAE